MKILKFLYGNDGGGVYQCEMQFIKYWINKGVVVDAIIIGEGKSSERYKQIVNQYKTLPNINLTTKGPLYLKVLKNIFILKRYNRQSFKIIDQFNLNTYDAVIFRRHFFAIIASKVSNIVNADLYWHMPLSVSGLLERYYFNRLVKEHNIKVIGNSKYSVRTIGNLSTDFVYPGFNSDRVATSETKPLLRYKLSIPEEAAVFGVAARIIKRKGQHLLIAAFIQLLQKYKNAHLIIAGGPLDSIYAKYCLKLAANFKENIHFIGHFENMPEFYASIDIYVNSRIDAEPFGISVAESLGSGLPVIAYREGGPSEMVFNNNGWLINSPNSKSYYLALQNAIINKDKWNEMGRNSRRYSILFNSDHNANKFLDIINRYNEKDNALK